MAPERPVPTIRLLAPLVAITMLGFHKYVARYDLNATATLDPGEPPSQSACSTETRKAPRGRGRVRVVTCSVPGATIDWIISDYEIDMELHDLGVSPISLDGNAFTFTDPDGVSQPMMATTDWPRLAPPGAVAPGLSVNVDLFPKGYVRVQGDHLSRIRTLFDPPGFRVGKRPEEIVEAARVNEGKTFKIAVSMGRPSESTTVTTTFRVASVGARDFWNTF